MINLPFIHSYTLACEIDRSKKSLFLSHSNPNRSEQRRRAYVRDIRCRTMIMAKADSVSFFNHDLKVVVITKDYARQS